MNGNHRMRSWAAVIGLTLVLTATSAAQAGSRQPKPAVNSVDGWYYTAIRHGQATRSKANLASQALDGWYYTAIRHGQATQSKANLARQALDGWYYTAIRHGQATSRNSHEGKARSAAGTGSQCRTNRTFQEAAKAGDMPAIVAALHGGAPIPDSFLTNC